jgi:peptidoglycan hydrolase-like protein with peptidoglycan-binding domain
LFGAGENAGGATPLAAGGATPPPRQHGRRNVILIAAAALVVIAGGLTWAFASSHTGTAAASVQSHPAKTAPPLRVVSVTPATDAHQVNGGAPITVVYSAPLAAGSPTPTLSPAVKGTWAPATTKAKGKKPKTTATSTMVFTPATGFRPHSSVTITIPAGPDGVRSAAGGLLSSEVTSKFRTGGYSTLRLQQLLAQLGYLPLTWTASGSSPAATDAQGQLSAAYSPPAGTFTWQSGYPRTLRDMWQAGSNNMIDVGAIRAFESVEGLTMDGIAGPVVWKDLLRAEAKGRDNPNGYTYAIASKATPETLTIWHDGHVVLHTLANTGIPAAPTANGTYPVYEKLPFQIMRGTNPDGSHYADPVQNVSYFDAGEAVHYFPRGSYGWQQSLGCVELPLAPSAVAYRYLSYGSLVTVQPA